MRSSPMMKTARPRRQPKSRAKSWRSWPLSCSLWLLLAVFGACSEAEAPPAAGSGSVPAASPAVGAETDAGSGAAATRERPLVVFLGDSLTAGFGLSVEQAYPALLEELLASEGRLVEVQNAGVSGDTTAGGRSRLDWLLRRKPDLLVVALGGNDGLRGLSVAASTENLRAIITGARAAGAAVLLLGLRMPPNYGPQYTTEFAAMYGALAEELDVPLVPYFLEGVGGDPALNLPDGIHPNAEGQRRVAQNVLPALRELLEE
ncbi:MAG: arylesterase [Planctomycetota bacterium]